MTNPLPLPLSQQVLAWALRALGFAEDLQGRVAEGTLKSARKGTAIPQRWDDLVDLVLDIAQVSRSRAAREAVHAALRSWDERVSSLPPMPELPLRERLHVPLTCVLPELGIRLGALTVVVARASGSPVDAWAWLTSPFDRRFFGRLVKALMDKRFAGMTKDERMGALEHSGEPVSWRTLERWAAGDSGVPNYAELPAFAELLGDGAEPILRMGRMVCELRETMSGVLGADTVADWASCVTSIAVATATWLSEPGAVREIAGWLADDLEGTNGDAVGRFIGILLAAPVPGPRDLAAALRAAASNAEHPGETQRTMLRLTLLKPHPRLIQKITTGLGAQGMAMLGATDVFRLFEADWTRRSLVHQIAAGGTLAVGDGTGAQADWVIPDDVQAAASRLASRPLRFTRAEGEPAVGLDEDERRVFAALFGEGSVAVTILQTSDPGQLVLATADPSVEMHLPDDVVASVRRLAFARACRLAEARDQAGAIRWLGIGLKLDDVIDVATRDRVVRTYAALAHDVLDQLRTLRALTRQPLAPDERASALAALQGALPIAEALLTQALEIGEAPAGTHAWVETLVVVVPVVFRVAVLRSELEVEDDGYHSDVADGLVEDLAAGATHGRAWALRSLWHWVWDEKRDAKEAATAATHFGAGAFLAAERERLEADLALPQGVGD